MDLSSVLSKANGLTFQSAADVVTASKLISAVSRAINPQTTPVQRQEAAKAIQHLCNGLLGPPPSAEATATTTKTPTLAMGVLGDGMVEGLAPHARFCAKHLGLDMAPFSRAVVSLTANHLTPPATPPLAWSRWQRIMGAAADTGLHYTRDVEVQQAVPVMTHQLTTVGMDTTQGGVVPGVVWAPLVDNMGQLGIPAAVANPVLDLLASKVSACKTISTTWIRVAEGLAGMGSKHTQLVGMCATNLAQLLAQDTTVRLHNVARAVHALVQAGATREQVQGVVAAASAAVKAGRSELRAEHMRGLSREQVAADLSALGIKDDVFVGAFAGLPAKV